MDAAQTGATAICMATADYGTVVIQSASDIVPGIAAAFERLGPMLREQPITAILATGPSATADLRALVRGVHCPKRVHIVIVENR